MTTEESPEPDEPRPDESSPAESSEGTSPAEEPPEHHEDGLDLARSLAKATARALPTGVRPRRTTGAGAGAWGARRRGTGRVSGAFPDERDPQTLDSTLGRLVSDHGWAVDLRVHGVFGRWAELVGDEVASHCTPEAFADGKLTVRTDSTAWATQLRLLAPTIVRRLNEELGHGTVVLIEVLGPHLPTWKKGPRSVRDGRGPRDTYG
ncbi:DciA family protein [Nocardioides pacificus]